jgi:hypothetical protein
MSGALNLGDEEKINNKVILWQLYRDTHPYLVASKPVHNKSNTRPILGKKMSETCTMHVKKETEL